MEIGHPWHFKDVNSTERNETNTTDCVWYDALQKHWIIYRESTDQGQAAAIFQQFSVPTSESSLFLECGPPIPIPIPLPLTQRRPVLVKLSLDYKILAIQCSDTQLRIVPLEELKQWTIDLAIDTIPQLSYPITMTKHRTNRLKLYKNTYRILDGGIFWTEHSGTSQDLIICTDSGLLLYKISPKKGISATYTFHHASDQCWMEPVSRTLVVGSKAPHGFTMRTYVLISEAKQSHFPRLEVPPPHRLPTFTTTAKRMEVVSLYSKVFCVEMETGRVQWRLLGDNHTPVDVCHIDMDGFQTSDDLLLFVINNLIVLHYRNANTSIIIDIQDKEYVIQVKDSISLEHVNVFDTELVTCGPGFVQGTEVVHPITLDLERIKANWVGHKCIIPFLLRRASSDKIHSLVLNELVPLLRSPYNKQGRQSWLNSVFVVYEQSKSIWPLDCQMSHDLMLASTLLPKEMQDRVVSDLPKVPSNILKLPHLNEVLTQSSILENFLLPAAQQAIDKKIDKDLMVVLDFAVELLGVLCRYDIAPVPAFRCLLAAMLWRFGHFNEIVALVKSNVIENTSKESNDRLVEVLFAIVTETTFGCGTHDDMTRVVTKEIDDIKMELYSLLISTMSGQLAAKYLLSSGRLLDAVSLCTNIVNGDTVESTDEYDLVGLDPQSTINLLVRGDDFFVVALEHSKLLYHNVGSRSRLMFHIYRFLLLWDPNCLLVESLPVVPPSKSNSSLSIHESDKKLQGLSSNVECGDNTDKDVVSHPIRLSALARSHPDFPDALFGGRESNVCHKIRKMFGYSDLV